MQYIADPQSAPDRHHFDNPVYSYQTSPRTVEDGTGLLLNNVHKIRNDLGYKNNNTKFEQQKLGLAGCTADDDDTGSCAGAYGLSYEHPASAKNKDADACNPNVNVYHSIEDLSNSKVEHVYDEIKQKEGQDMEYDHLDYSRPASSWKPHYQRMANGIGPPKDPNAPDDKPSKSSD